MVSRSFLTPMINSVSSTPSASAAVLAHAVAQPKAQQTPSTLPEDSVELSSKAAANASGGVNNEG